MTTQKEYLAARKAKKEREVANKYHILWQYYATGEGVGVPIERVAYNLGVNLPTAIYNLEKYGRKDQAA